MWAGKILRRLHLCTISPKPSLVTYAPYCVYEPGRFWQDYTCAQSPLNLRWSLILYIVCMWAGKILTRLHLCTVFPEPLLVTHPPFIVCVSREDSDETTLVHSLPWTFAGHLCSILYVCEQGWFCGDCTRAQRLLNLFWSILRVWERGREQGVFGWDYTCAQSPLCIRWSLTCMLHIACMWAGMILRRLYLCTASSEPSLVTYAPYCVYVSREDSGETVLVHSLSWAFPDHLCSVLCVCEQGRFWRDCTCAQSLLSLPWPLMLRIGCMWAGKIETRLHLCTVSPEPSLTTYAPYCEYEQGRFWQDCSWA